MTVSSSAKTVVALGDGETASFTYPHLFYTATDLRVACVSDDGTNRDLTAECTISGMGDPRGGTVMVSEPPARGHHIIITRQVPYTQELDLTESGRLSANSLEKRLDLIVMMVQQLHAICERCIKSPLGEGESMAFEIPGVADRADKVLGFDEQGNPIVSSLTLQQLEDTETISLESAKRSQEAAASVQTMLQEITDALTEAQSHTVEAADLKQQLSLIKDELVILLEEAKESQSADWPLITGKPETFPATPHTHSMQDLPGLHISTQAPTPSDGEDGDWWAQI